MNEKIEQQRGRGRPVEKEWPELIPDTLESVMLALLESPPRKESDWKYLKKENEKVEAS